MFTIAKSAGRSGRTAAIVQASRHLSSLHTPSAAASSALPQPQALLLHQQAQAHPRNCTCSAHANIESVVRMSAMQAAAASPAPSSSLSSPSLSSPFDLLSFLSGLPQPAPVQMPTLPADGLMLPLDIPEQIEAAVPKRKTSVSRQRHRRAGQRLQNRRRVYQNYRVCFVCGRAVLQHHLCTKCMTIPTRS